MTTEATAEVDELLARFGGVIALDSVTLSFAAGQVCGLIGPNGAGKSTLLNCLSGDQRPTSGRVRLLGRDVTDTSATQRARGGIGRTFQRQQPFGWLTAAENVGVALEWPHAGWNLIADALRLPSRRRADKVIRATVDHVLELCALTADRDAIAATLPTGKIRLLELARAMARSPRLLLLDEPTSGLDSYGRDVVGAVIEGIRSAGDCSVLLVEHDLRFVMEHCDRVVVLDLGRVIEDGTVQDVQTSDAVTNAFLGVHLDDRTE